MTEADRLTADDDGTVYACPDCDRAGSVYRRNGSNTHIGDEDDPFACEKCSATFESPVERQPKNGSQEIVRRRIKAALQEDTNDER